jgi:DNA-binding XRE family transcriptional regulator
MEASIETGRLAEAICIANELGQVLRTQVLLVDGVLDVLTPDDRFIR